MYAKCESNPSSLVWFVSILEWCKYSRGPQHFIIMVRLNSGVRHDLEILTPCHNGHMLFSWF
jgi:hypothetical protein